MKQRQIETEEEMRIVEAVEKGEFSPLEGDERKEMEALLGKAAERTVERLTRRKPISIRLLENDIERIKAMAMNEGMPYQTYIAHILHKLTTGRLRPV
jgi:predicted DNA binding CopG/RHH family protein